MEMMKNDVVDAQYDAFLVNHYEFGWTFFSTHNMLGTYINNDGIPIRLEIVDMKLFLHESNPVVALPKSSAVSLYGYDNKAYTLIADKNGECDIINTDATNDEKPVFIPV